LIFLSRSPKLTALPLKWVSQNETSWMQVDARKFTPKLIFFSHAQRMALKIQFSGGEQVEAQHAFTCPYSHFHINKLQTVGWASPTIKLWNGLKKEWAMPTLLKIAVRAALKSKEFCHLPLPSSGQ
jgi:hypothetical protein